MKNEKRVSEWIESIPDIAVKINLNYAIPEDKKNLMFTERQFIFGLFEWASTAEGYEYWKAIFKIYANPTVNVKDWIDLFPEPEFIPFLRNMINEHKQKFSCDSFQTMLYYIDIHKIPSEMQETFRSKRIGYGYALFTGKWWMCCATNGNLRHELMKKFENHYVNTQVFNSLEDLLKVFKIETCVESVPKMDILINNNFQKQTINDGKEIVSTTFAIITNGEKPVGMRICGKVRNAKFVSGSLGYRKISS